jgi:ketosteroid isomerase-like protein
VVSQENLEIVRAVHDAFLAGLQGGQFGGGLDSGLLADDFEFSPAPELTGDTTYGGVHGFVEFMRLWTEDFEDWSVRLERLIEAPDDCVVAFMHQSGTGKGSGVPVDLDYGAVFRLREGRVVRVNLYMTPEQALQAAGLET